MAEDKNDFDYVVDRFADIEVLRYPVPDFDKLSLSQKMLVYHLTEAALAGRDILWDQNCRLNLELRDMLEKIYTGYQGDRNDPQFKAFEKYLKQVWFANGVHHHYSMDKFTPEFSRKWIMSQLVKMPDNQRPPHEPQLIKLIFDPTFMAKRVNQAEGEDLIRTSAVNMYEEGLTQKEIEDYYNARKDTTDLTPISYGLNTKKVKRNGQVCELPYKLGGLYSNAIERIIRELSLASIYAENPAQKAYIDKLIEFYRTGDLKTFDDYSILWAEETASQVDFINGFIESYGDPLGMTGIAAH